VTEARDEPGRPNVAGLLSVIDDLGKSIGNLATVQQRLMGLTGVAWSKDGLVKAVVGPRGHLVELEIDPRVYRTPNSKQLGASVLETVAAATKDVADQVDDVLREQLPTVGGLIGPGMLGGLDLRQVAETAEARVRDAAREGGI
jgi:DNA-binding protein YbaB